VLAFTPTIIIRLIALALALSLAAKTDL